MHSDELQFLTTEYARQLLAEHIHDDPATFALTYQNQTDFPARVIAEQLACRKKALTKLPVLSQQPLFYEAVALEQCSSEATARYKTKIMFGSACLDCTGGLGIDAFYFGRVFDSVTYCEKDLIRARLFSENIHVMGCENVIVKNEDCIQVLRNAPDNAFDWIYVDPSRRDSTRRYIGFAECEPNVIELLPLFFQKAKQVAIKASPAFDLTEAERQLPGLHTSIIVSVDGECKEALFLLGQEPPISPVTVKAVLLRASGEVCAEAVRIGNENVDRLCTQTIGRYWYVPDPAVIKARCAESVSREFCIAFVNKSVDYLSSDRCVVDFPGKIYEVISVVSWQRRHVSKYLSQHSITHANIARRDFPLAPEEIVKKLGIVHGGDDYLFFTRDLQGKPIVVHAKRVEVTTD